MKQGGRHPLRWILRDLVRANRGPLTADGLRAFYEELFALTKREVARDA